MSAKIEKEIARIAGALILHHDDAATLRRAALTLHRWAEGECGDSNCYASFCIVREPDGKTYRETVPHTGKRRMDRIPDRETGALRRVAEVCARYGLHYFHQTDPRGLAIYVSQEPLDATNYTRGTGIGGI